MLTRDDATVPDAREHASLALSLGVKHIGFKDVGLPRDSLNTLHQDLKSGGATTYLEVVSLDADSEAASAEMAVSLNVDVLMGGQRPDVVAPMIRGTDIHYAPFPGKIHSHPSVLTGSKDEIVRSAVSLAECPDVHGLDLLAYRAETDPVSLIHAVCNSVSKPVTIAGSIDHPEQIKACFDAGAAAFTIGTAALNGVFPASSASLADQIQAIMAATPS